MSVDRTKILEAAQKHLAKGAYDKAIAEFTRLVKADPTDVRTWLKIGDLYTKQNKKREAVDTYARVADQYASQGFFLKAVAVHKQILKLDPTRLDVQLKLAEMYEMLQLVSDALSTYEHVAASFARAGDIDRALSTLAKMVELDPENIPTRIKLAEALSKANRTREAADAFEAGARLLKQQGRIDDYIKVAERLLFHREGDVAVSRELAQLYLERNDAKRALAKLQTCFKADPKDIPTLEMLGTAFHQLGQLPKTISVYREVARIHGEAQRHEDRARTLKRILELDPGDAEARQALAAFAAPAAPQPVAAAPLRRDLAPPPGAVIASSRRAPPPEPELEEAEDEDVEAEVIEPSDMHDLDALPHDDDSGDVIIVDDDDDDSMQVSTEDDEPPQREAPRPSAAASARASLPPEIAREAQIAKLLTECEVFLRYGLKQKVIDQLRRVLELDPGHVAARERLKDVLVDRGELEAAAAELVTLADQFATTRPPVAILYLRQALEIDEGNAEARARLAGLGADESQPARPALASAPTPVPEPLTQEAPTGEDAGVFFVDDDDDTADRDVEDATEDRGPRAVTSSLPPYPEERISVPPPASEPPADPLRDTLTGARPPRLAAIPPAPSSEQPTQSVSLDSIPPEPARPPAVLTSAPPTSPSVRVPRPSRRPDDLLEPISPEEFESAPLRPSSPQQIDAERMQRQSLPPGEVEEILEEAEFFVAQGLFEEAKQVLRDALNAHPRNTLLADKLAEVEDQRASAVASLPPASVDSAFELAERLADDLAASEEHVKGTGSDVLDVEQVFAQFKKGVEQQVGLEDTDTHFDLGIAYKEMGLLQDAIAEFQICLSNPTKQCIAHTMIGLCHIEKGEVTEAISHFKKGLYAETKTDREELGLYFELGRAYELLHDPKEALYYYEKVKKRDGTFRNVQDRIVALTRPAAPVAAAPTEDIDAAFDDLMGKVE